FRSFARSGQIATRKSNNELVAAETAGERVVGKPHAHRLPNASNGIRAGQVTVHVIDRFQAVDIEDGERHRTTALAGAPDDWNQFRLEPAEVVEAGQIVGDGEAVELPSIVGELRRHHAD